MSFVDVHVQALEECGRQALRVRNMLDVQDAFVGSRTPAPKGDTKADIFGGLDGAGALAAKVDQVWESIGADLGAAQSLLKGVNEALGQVAGNIRRAENASGA
ncbi:hypothetical protein [Nonomuraea jiangxiensis]|uniref:Excreted virulence factor EspC, type VII ESX diderm n=1 Tax=Nonomuraea jiangxiensis TaxID=633440 RepID=A0A1G8FJG0_9ACTN|nr:hypothetical protein [Nonomuraea jiangxiensis]SDH82293.1 hypothetical protein SAMN05421869_103338 [Nonomuraea jiangxiensis]